MKTRSACPIGSAIRRCSHSKPGHPVRFGCPLGHPDEKPQRAADTQPRTYRSAPGRDPVCENFGGGSADRDKDISRRVAAHEFDAIVDRFRTVDEAHGRVVVVQVGQAELRSQPRGQFLVAADDRDAIVRLNEVAEQMCRQITAGGVRQMLAEQQPRQRTHATLLSHRRSQAWA